MNIQPYHLFSSLLLLLIPAFTPIHADTQESRLQETYKTLIDIQKALSKNGGFYKAQNDERVSKDISRLRKSFHSYKATGKEPDPGFEESVRIVERILDDALAAFQQGKKQNAHFQLKFSIRQCVSCHTRFDAPVEFKTLAEDVAGLTELEKGDLYLASRQFKKAEKAFMESIKQSNSLERFDAIRNLIILYTRVTPDPAGAIKKLTTIESETDFSEYEREDLEKWKSGFKRWELEDPDTPKDHFEKAELLIKQAKLNSALSIGNSNAIEFLRATSRLHKALEGGTKKRAEALYLLGYAYSELPLFFEDLYAEFYLERCILEIPHSDFAKKSYRLYRELITLDFTGSRGTYFPAENKNKLEKLYRMTHEKIEN